MPRLFPSLGRSREAATPPHYQFNEGYSNQYTQDSNIPSWRRPFSRKKNQKWPEEFVEYPSRAVSYAEGYAPSIGSNTQYRRPTVDDYLDDDDDTLAGENAYYATDSSQPGPIPLVQRENSFHSSFSRLQDAFSDRRGHASQAVTELPLPTPTQTHRHSTDFPPPPHLQVPQAGHGVGPSGLQPTSEHHGSFFVPQHPVLINNTGIDSVRPDIVHPDPGHGPGPILHNIPRQPEYSERPDYGYDDRQRSRSQRRRTSSHHRSPRGSLEDYRFEMFTDHGKISDFQPDEDYPPCVVVVKRARRKEDDTYYLLPGGAPVIFTDENGNELKRVGDFSGRYTPQPMRPVIIKDEEDREIYRAWFDDDDSESSSLSRSEDSFYSSARHGGRHDHHDGEYYDQDQEYRRDKNYTSSHRSRRSNDSNYDDYDNFGRSDHRPRGSSSRSGFNPEVYSVDPYSFKDNQPYKFRVSSRPHQTGSPRYYEFDEHSQNQHSQGIDRGRERGRRRDRSQDIDWESERGYGREHRERDRRGGDGRAMDRERELHYDLPSTSQLPSTAPPRRSPPRGNRAELDDHTHHRIARSVGGSSHASGRSSRQELRTV